MQFLKFKSVQILSNGSLSFHENNGVKHRKINFLTEDLKNFEFYNKRKIGNKNFFKFSSTYKKKYFS